MSKKSFLNIKKKDTSGKKGGGGGLERVEKNEHSDLLQIKSKLNSEIDHWDARVPRRSAVISCRI